MQGYSLAHRTSDRPVRLRGRADEGTFDGRSLTHHYSLLPNAFTARVRRSPMPDNKALDVNGWLTKITCHFRTATDPIAGPYGTGQCELADTTHP